jgi:ABC-2 type transport system permease protein
MSSTTTVPEAAIAAGAQVREAAPHGSTRGWLVMWRVELRKLAALLRVRVIVAGCVLGPVLAVLAVKVTNTTPGDTLFGVWIRASGFAFSLVILNWAGLWALPMSISVVAGDICSGEHRLGTWATLLTRSRSRSEILVGKMLATATYTVAITLLVAIATTAVGLVAIGQQSLVGLSGSLLDPHTALLATIGSWASILAPMLALTGIAMLSSVLSRNSWIGVLVPVVVFGVLNLGSLVSAVDPIRPFLPTTGIEAWHGLVRADVYTDQIWVSVLVSLAWTMLSFGLAAFIFLRRDVVDS